MSGHSIHIKIDGRTYSGTYKVDRQVLTVTTNYGRKTAQVGPQVSHAALADQLLHELVKEEKAGRAQRFDQRYAIPMLNGFQTDESPAMLKAKALRTQSVYVPTKRRTTLDPVKVAQLAESILAKGETTPILVREDGDRFVLVEGLHRLEACKALGEETILAYLVQARRH